MSVPCDSCTGELKARVAAAQSVRALLCDLRPGGPARHLGNLGGSAKSLLVDLVASTLGKVLLVVPSEDQVAWVVEDLRHLGAPVHELPSLEVLPYEDTPPDPEVAALRVEALASLVAPEPTVVVTSAAALLPRVPASLAGILHARRVAPGSPGSPQELAGFLARVGFRRVPWVEERGQFSVRGGILDVFPPGVDQPVRIEFDGDLVDSLRFFSPQTQRSTHQADGVVILPVDDVGPLPPGDLEDELPEECVALARREGVTQAQLDRMMRTLQHDPFAPARRWWLPLWGIPTLSVLEFAPDVTVVVHDLQGVSEALEEAFSQAQTQYERALRLQTGFPVLSPPLLFGSREVLEAQVRERTRLELGAPLQETLGIHPMEPFGGSVRLLADRLRELEAHDFDVWVSCENEGQRARLEELLPMGPRVRLWPGGLRFGFLWPQERVALITDYDVFGRYGRRRPSRRHHAGLSVLNLTRLSPGDYVVHAFHGIGRFQGLQRISVMGRDQEVLTILYRGGDKLHVPVEQCHLVERYVGPDASAPALDSLGGSAWRKTKSRVREAVRDLAEELLRLYALRQALPGFAFPPNPWEDELVSSFPFEETPDQRTAWEEIRADMASERPMDRLVCGDVGFGKTELAIRAAFKAVVAGKQVAVLVPTTILAEQHLQTFRERLAEYPVIVEMLSRFKTPKEQREIVRSLREGRIDIVIGTHRLLQKDVAFKDLGLVIIDEEQRFGVEHKEHLKKLRTQVDVLTMTATPIPRTLYLALAGARDLSVVNTPPQGRVPHITVVAPFHEELITEGILREVARGGQVFFVHNRVESIRAMADFLARRLPEVRFAVAHGQMPERDLERVMHSFIHREVDVLVCTMIIESGLDIPGVDTIFINRADRFGLAQLYQLRGRVGRGSRQAYAYLLVPPFRTLTAQARRRLEALRQFSELGSGLRLSLVDLEIRGIGNILGRDQHGHVAEVGFQMYCRMLEDEVRRLRGEAPAPRRELVVRVEPPVSLPADYVPDEAMRVAVYSQLGTVDSVEQLEATAHDLRDRFGPLPPEAQRFLRAVRLKVLLQRHPVSAVTWAKGRVVVTLDGQPLDRALLEAAARCEGTWQTQGETSSLTIQLSPPTPEGAELDILLDALERGART